VSLQNELLIRSLIINGNATTYMLAGATQRNDSDPYDDSGPLIKIGLHWMIIMWPFDPAATGLPSSHRSTGAYIVWPETPYAHLRIMGSTSGA
jgi:hypothetical protein